CAKDRGYSSGWGFDYW
nr:immunoglobulin heavy chain junction region [Macaca mulatta]MOY25533.1 immunoglobulin heavy chain junction region [Macaca mulatta]MOY27195.1 immunoglobulin heavy chain junction region [Macaca mulatta]MOY28698.1 immunoglobulin heavy chain junction region [Macaca mulatta]